MILCNYCQTEQPDSEFRKQSRQCRTCKKAENRAHYAEKKADIQTKQREWRERNPQRLAYAQQKDNASKRGISWDFSFDTWIKFWGGDIDKRGCTENDLVCARHGDVGPYSPENCFKQTSQANASEGSRRRWSS